MKNTVLVESEGEVTDQSDALFWEQMLGDDKHVTTFLEDAERARASLRIEGREGEQWVDKRLLKR